VIVIRRRVDGVMVGVRVAMCGPAERTDGERKAMIVAHGLEIDAAGRGSMVYVGKTPWHGLGTRFDAPPSWQEASEACGAGYKVLTAGCYTQDGRELPAQYTYREDTQDIFGVVGPAYTVLQNSEMFQWFSPLIDSGLVELHTAGVLWGGKKAWCLARIAGKNLEVQDGDEIERFVLLSNAHDGSRAARAGFTPIRVVCANTEALAVNSEESNLVRLLHTSGIKSSLNALRDVMNTANSQFESTVEQYRRLAKTPINRQDIKAYVRKVLKIKPDEKVHTRTENKMRDIVAAAVDGRGNHGKTLWDAYNGVTEWLSYTSSKTDDRRVDSLWFGEAATLSSRALAIAVEMAG